MDRNHVFVGVLPSEIDFPRVAHSVFAKRITCVEALPVVDAHYCIAVCPVNAIHASWVSSHAIYGCVLTSNVKNA
jgi:hypothetical protein